MSAFISEEIEAIFDQEPVLEKRTGVPDGFTWRGRTYRIVSLLREWHDYMPRGKSKAMYEKERGSYWVKAVHQQGTWGVGRDYYRVRADSGGVFDIYYDRKPKGRKQKGTWILWRRVDEKHQGGENEP